MKKLRVNALRMIFILLLSASLVAPWATAAATSQVTPGSIGPGSPAILASHFVEVDFLGDKTIRALSEDNGLVEPFVAGTDDGYITLAMRAGTSFASESGRTPARIVFQPGNDAVLLAPNEYIIGDIYRLDAFAADGSVIDLDCSPGFRLTVNYGPGDVRANTTSVYLARYDGVEKSWQPFEESDRQTLASPALSTGSQGGVYAAIAAVSAPALSPSITGIQVQDLSLSPASLSSGSPVTVRADVVNAGWSAESRTFKLTLSGAVVGTTTVSLAPGQRRELSHSFTPARPGTYDVELGHATAVLTVSSPVGDQAKSSPPLAWLNASVQKGWPVLFLVLLLGLASVFVIARLGSRRPALAHSASTAHAASTASPVQPPLSPPPPLPPAAPQPAIRKRATRRRLNPVVETITGPTRRMKATGPYTYGVKVAGGKPPYTIEWRGNGVTLAVTDSEQVELLREQTWDSGKGNWVFVMVRDSKGKYAEWIDEDGKPKRLFTYGVTSSGKVVTSPTKFPYDEPLDRPET